MMLHCVLPDNLIGTTMGARIARELDKSVRKKTPMDDRQQPETVAEQENSENHTKETRTNRNPKEGIFLHVNRLELLELAKEKATRTGTRPDRRVNEEPQEAFPTDAKAKLSARSCVR